MDTCTPSRNLVRKMSTGLPQSLHLRFQLRGRQQRLESPPQPSRQLWDWNGRRKGEPGAVPQPALHLLRTLPAHTSGPCPCPPRATVSPHNPWEKALLPETGLPKLLNWRLGMFCKSRTRTQRHNLSNTVAPGTRAMITTTAAVKGRGGSQLLLVPSQGSALADPSLPGFHFLQALKTAR